MVLANKPAPGVRYFTPSQYPQSGVASATASKDGGPLPKLFTPLKVRGVEFHNRIFLSPLCQHSANEGSLTTWHTAHLGGIVIRGAGLTMIESTAILPEGRITPEDVGLWSDEHIEPLRNLVEFAHSQGQKIGIQLGHAGRKASVLAPWVSFTEFASAAAGGWPDDVWAPSGIRYNEAHCDPKELSWEGIKRIVQAWSEATRRALKAGVDVIEIHAAHGYLLHQFMTPVSNSRTDEYGGSFENRIRLTLEVVDAVRAIIPETMPLFVRISATDWLEESLPDTPSWRIEDSVRFAGIAAKHGVDLIDVSSGGSHPLQNIKIGPLSQAPYAYQAHFSEAIRKEHGIDSQADPDSRLCVGAVGGVRNGQIAEGVLKAGQADVVFVGRQFQRDPAVVWTFAEELGVKVKVSHQIEWGFVGRGSSRNKLDTN